MSTQNERVREARAARARWDAAVRAGLGHPEINDRWEVYVRLANLAGPDILSTLEREELKDWRRSK